MYTTAGSLVRFDHTLLVMLALSVEIVIGSPRSVQLASLPFNPILPFVTIFLVRFVEGVTLGPAVATLEMLFRLALCRSGTLELDSPALTV